MAARIRETTKLVYLVKQKAIPVKFGALSTYSV